MAVMHKTLGAKPCLSAQGAKQYQLIFAVGFAIFLVIALVGRVLPRRWRPVPPGPQAELSVIKEAKVMADTYVPFAFMA